AGLLDQVLLQLTVGDESILSQRIDVLGDGGVGQHGSPQSGTDDGTSQSNTLSGSGTLDRQDVRDVGRTGLTPGMLGLHNIAGSPGTLRIVVVVVVHHDAALVGRGDGDGTVLEQLETHDLGVQDSAIDQSSAVIEQLVDDGLSVLPTSS